MAENYKENNADDSQKYDYHNLIDNLSSRWVIISSINGNVTDGEAGKGTPFANSIARTLLKNNNSKLSTSEFFTQLRMDIISSYTGRVPLPAIGILDNSTHAGGEFCFKLREDIVENIRVTKLEKDNTNFNQEAIAKSIQESLEKLKKELIQESEAKHKRLEERITELKQPKSSDRVLNLKELNQYIADDNMDKFFEKFNDIQDVLEKQIIIDILYFQSQWRSIENQRILGMIDSSLEILTKNKIRRGLLEVINFNNE